MLNNAIPANATPLPVVGLQHAVCVTGLPVWAASIGRTVADVAALMFVLPMPAHLHVAFEDAIRREVASELLRFDISVVEVDRIETIAWIAFSRRLASHLTTDL